MSVATATDGGEVPLDESFLTLVPHQRVDFVSCALLSEGSRVLHDGGLVAGHWRHSEGEKLKHERNCFLFFLCQRRIVPAALVPVPFLQVKVRW